ncbi:MAG: chromosome segregation protein SMC [Eubacterium sp.]|nr:chromosome segregation protein SMC [Eubacterium sp.]
MYLKSIEMHGFKSFANKIVLDFHNGITGIVGPNGSGKSNVSDAVRWVLGEQSARQLRGSSMQDVIFSGTENRKPLSYAYVAITMDNSDHMLDTSFEEVTVARRVYRSGESEYLLNGGVCRLRDVHELFYDTGIGKEGYSIIGQGQIEKILNGRPEERRELFDEAAGIVKYKRRKVTAQKKLETERENLIRLDDILSELERQVGPLKRQSEKAREYLKKKEELKRFDVNMFLLEIGRIDTQKKEIEENEKITDAQLKETSSVYSQIKDEYEKIEAVMEQAETEIEVLREQLNQSVISKGRLEGELNVLNEQIKAAELSDGHFKDRTSEIKQDTQEKSRQKAEYETQEARLTEQLLRVEERRQKAEEKLTKLQEDIRSCNEEIEKGQNELLDLLHQKVSMQAEQQKYETMIEQVNIRKAQLNQRLLQQKSEESDLDVQLEAQESILKEIREAIAELLQQEQKLTGRQAEWEQKLRETDQAVSEQMAGYHKTASRLESLRNIAERYDGYGNSIRRVMEQKDKEPGILGVVSDLIKVEKKYETAIETALGGSIQNIVTEDEQTAKRMITYLKQNRFGRATFLPLTSVKGKGGIKTPEALQEEGVIGLAHTLVRNDRRYDGIMAQLLGRVVVADTIDHAIVLAQKYHYTLFIVTLEGESLRPGGSMTGGAFKNSSNLLGRNREMEDLSLQVKKIKEALEAQKARRDEILTAQALLAEDLDKQKEQLQQQYLSENTAKSEADRIRRQKEEGAYEWKELQEDRVKLEQQLAELKRKQAQASEEIEAASQREAEIAAESQNYQKELDEKALLEGSVHKAFSEVQMEEANIRQRAEFTRENIRRVTEETEKLNQQIAELAKEAAAAREAAQQKKGRMEEMKKTLDASGEEIVRLETVLQEKLVQNKQMADEQKSFFTKREEISGRMHDLDKELLRLGGQKEKLDEERERQVNYMWEEYELTFHAAKELWNSAYDNLNELKKLTVQLKEEIRSLGDVNVNAIDEYKEVSERFVFLKTQHDDLVESEAALMDIIDDLDAGMRRQFSEKFEEIRQEFDRAFKELFGGGKGTLELVEDEDILECGIRIIAQPPGKKLQNMVLLSGGEKSLTAISLLFAIQNLKPSPFCLLDEIEAALDDSNVGRFAKYLHKLTKDTQFIVITHRRGTMAAADRLYGITMQEKGVSTMVSVDLIEGDLVK